eukprot:c9840_g1_i1.p1 GENE.c9840_g1_i1~~c9840_g1_i1.p1  ORF type:complete len:551 (+),score=161.05 c9840_g1_i1:3-1655(+)
MGGIVRRQPNMADEWADWEEEEEIQQTECLFCSDVFEGVTAAVKHLSSKHNFDLKQVTQTYGLDMYGAVKVVNFLRQAKQPHKTITWPEVFESTDLSFLQSSSEQYLISTNPTDPLLQYACSSCEDIEDKQITAPPPAASALLEENEALAAQVRELTKLVEQFQAKQKNQNTTGAAEEIPALEFAAIKPSATSLNQSSGAELENAAARFERRRREKVEKDSGYFESYARLSIHYDMLADRVRTDSYRDCIEVLNRSLFEGKVVLDVGCGTGILSMFAARAGAKQVIGVDSSDIIDKAVEIVKANGLSDKVTLIKGRVEQVTLPCDHVDIIISEWMGYFLLFESMLDTVLYARDKWMTKDAQGKLNGHVFPNRATMLAAASQLNRLAFWDNVYGFDYRSIVKGVVHRDAEVEVTDPADLISDFAEFKLLDMETGSVSDVQFRSNFSLHIRSATPVVFRAIVVHFDCFFDDFTGANKEAVVLSTSPLNTPTHWRQTVFVLDQPVTVTNQHTIHVTLTCTKNPLYPRELDVCLEYEVHANGHAEVKGVQMYAV